jgi:CheY-like chemotaxis protein
LTISHGLAQLLGGDLTATSQSGCGSSFQATIEPGPLDAIARFTDYRQQYTRPTSVQKKEQQQQPLIGCRILLVEDGPDNQRLIAFMLKKAGAKVTIADNSEIGRDQALQAMAMGESFDIIFMDMQMPVLDGYSATTQLREAGYEKPIIALTAHAMSHHRQQCIDVGCNDYTTKPINRQTLIATAKSYCGALTLS